jgi:hypothetical protein
VVLVIKRILILFLWKSEVKTVILKLSELVRNFLDDKNSSIRCLEKFCPIFKAVTYANQDSKWKIYYMDS